jgi:hypothetical protein
MQSKLFTNRNLKEMNQFKEIEHMENIHNPPTYGLETQSFSRILTLEEAIQTFDEKEDSCMFSLKLKPPESADIVESQDDRTILNEKIIRLRKQAIVVDGVE